MTCSHFYVCLEQVWVFGICVLLERMTGHGDVAEIGVMFYEVGDCDDGTFGV
jgi:hypothetical protein